MCRGRFPRSTRCTTDRGIEGSRSRLKTSSAIPPDYYFVVELDAVAELVDAIGGVDYEVP